MLSTTNLPERNLLTDNSCHQFVLFPWIRKKQSSWSLYSILNKHQSSILSLPLSAESSITIIPEQEVTVAPPPSYDDPLHPWALQIPNYLLNRIHVIPREEEGKEILPEYSCSVDKMTYMHVKCEFSKPNIRSKNRSWKDYYILVYGTQIMAYYRNPRKKKNAVPVWKYTMQGAEVSVASDYTKFRHVIRLKIEDGPQFLFTMLTETEKNEWINIIESSIHISSDLDMRKMPQFTTFRRRRRHQRSSQTTEQQQTR
ncbi:uncharacterized protein BX663DRAFT_521372 [Cokeromyces recurvatus]|uniref:uncharacterized protein n=1 Tax=Cokeromyces recurvatus TaxID=90255 RepID=UPI00221FEA29|nr:uncharacterized protein BX663DRAFT_521372 [Cokeromyces recurvatus]KAI7899341.1 hypothetical protein BX663DRAFT_521372 [Cokeromyces recurvatus]